MSLLKYVQENRVRLTSEEKSEVGKAHILKFRDKDGKEKFAVHEQPCFNVYEKLKPAIKMYWDVKNGPR